MEAQGFLSRATARDDARSVIISLTPSGRTVLAAAKQTTKALDSEIADALSPENSAIFDAVLTQLLARKSN
jgi:DNA-binding MarR family transcriptional regulator